MNETIIKLALARKAYDDLVEKLGTLETNAGLLPVEVLTQSEEHMALKAQVKDAWEEVEFLVKMVKDQALEEYRLTGIVHPHLAVEVEVNVRIDQDLSKYLPLVTTSETRVSGV
jgi:hypothetical protein